jgi:NAD(P)-dependent dehydrogenase (short-subunit alcohol dehydrogenase family)
MTDENAVGADPLGGSGPDAPKVAVVTGGSSGIGLAAAEQLARRGWVVALVGRNPDRLSSATDRVRAAAPEPARVHPYRADFTVLAQVRALAEELRADHPHIDLLANNAGGAFRRRTITADGFEVTMQVNHLAPFLLSNLLRETLAGGRIINTSSGAHATGRLDPADLNSSGPPSRALGYGSSKQANILFAIEATRRWPDIISVAYHPGLVRTNFGNDQPAVAFFIRWVPFIPPPAKGADTLVWLAERPLIDLVPGGYYQRRRLRTPAPRATDPTLAAELWEASTAAVGL